MSATNSTSSKRVSSMEADTARMRPISDGEQQVPTKAGWSDNLYEVEAGGKKAKANTKPARVYNIHVVDAIRPVRTFHVYGVFAVIAVVVGVIAGNGLATAPVLLTAAALVGFAAMVFGFCVLMQNRILITYRKSDPRVAVLCDKIATLPNAREIEDLVRGKTDPNGDPYIVRHALLRTQAELSRYFTAGEGWCSNGMNSELHNKLAQLAEGTVKNIVQINDDITKQRKHRTDINRQIDEINSRFDKDVSKIEEDRDLSVSSLKSLWADDYVD